jgi:hypothetical protein
MKELAGMPPLPMLFVDQYLFLLELRVIGL